MTSERGPLVVPVTADASEWLAFDPGGSGWASYGAVRRARDAGRPRLFVRLGPDRGRIAEPALVDGQPAIVPRDTPELTRAVILIREVLVSFDAKGATSGVGPRMMRDLPLARIEAAVNQPMYREAVLSYLPPTNTTMSPFPWASGPPEWLWARPAPRRRPRLRLKVPEGRGKPDEFYRQVAERFAYLTTVSTRPATELAEANDVPVARVHGWVKEARRRGLLAPGERSLRGQEQQS